MMAVKTIYTINVTLTIIIVNLAYQGVQIFFKIWKLQTMMENSERPIEYETQKSNSIPHKRKMKLITACTIITKVIIDFIELKK